MENSHGAVRMTFLKKWILKQSAVKSRCFKSGRATPLPRTCLLPFRAQDPFRLGCYCARGSGGCPPCLETSATCLLPGPRRAGPGSCQSQAGARSTPACPLRALAVLRARTRIGMRHVRLSVVRGDTGVSGCGQLINRSFVPF